MNDLIKSEFRVEDADNLERPVSKTKKDTDSGHPDVTQICEQWGTTRENMVQLVDAKREPIPGGLVTFERKTEPNFVQRAEIELKEEELTMADVVVGDDIDSDESMVKMAEAEERSHVEATIINLFRMYYEKTHSDILRAQQPDLIERPLGHAVTLSKEHTYIIAHSGADTMRDLIKSGLSLPSGLAREKFSTQVVDDKLFAAGLGFSATFEYGDHKYTFDFLYAEDNKSAAIA